MGIRTLPSDHFMIFNREIHLSAQAKGKLAPEDWRPIFASGLIYFKKLRRDYLLRWLATTLPIFLFFPIAGVVFRGENNPIILLVILSTGIGLLVANVAFILVYPRRLWFKSDSEAVRLVGLEAMISSLQKLDIAISAQTGKRKRVRARPPPMERMLRLSTHSDRFSSAATDQSMR